MSNHDTGILAALGERAASVAIASDTAGAIRVETARDRLWDILEKNARTGRMSWELAKHIWHNEPSVTVQDVAEMLEED